MIRNVILGRGVDAARDTAGRLLHEAEGEKKRVVLEAKAEAFRTTESADSDARERRQEAQRAADRSPSRAQRPSRRAASRRTTRRTLRQQVQARTCVLRCGRLTWWLGLANTRAVARSAPGSGRAHARSTGKGPPHSTSTRIPGDGVATGGAPRAGAGRHDPPVGRRNAGAPAASHGCQDSPTQRTPRAMYDSTVASLTSVPATRPDSIMTPIPSSTACNTSGCEMSPVCPMLCARSPGAT